MSVRITIALSSGEQMQGGRASPAASLGSEDE